MMKSNYYIPDDYMLVDDIELIKKLLVSLLNDFHKICEENGLTYNAFGGTMLGAVRHKGMIPWDDDIDVTMPDYDYDRFIDIVKNKYSDKFQVLDSSKKEYMYPFAKFVLNDSILVEDNYRKPFNLSKLYIDVFPVYGYPKNAETVFKDVNKIKYKKCRCVQKFILPIDKWKTPYYLIDYALGMINRIHSPYYYVNKEINILSQYSFNDSDIISCNGAGWYEKGKLSKDVYLDRVLYDFDGIKIWGIRDYHDHLYNLYGDYMQLPPENNRCSEHNYRLYVKKRSNGGIYK